MAAEYTITIHGCSGGPISFWSLPDSQVPPSLWPLSDTDVRVLWRGGYVRSSIIRVPAVDVSSAAATPVALHRGGPAEREWPPTPRLDLAVPRADWGGPHMARALPCGDPPPLEHAGPARIRGCGIISREDSG